MMEARKAFLIILNNGFGAALGIVALFFVGRYMGPAPLGMVGFAIALVGMGTIIANFGLPQAHIKRISQGEDLGDCVATYTVLKLATTTAAALLVGGSALWWGLTRGFTDATTVTVVGVALAHFFLLHLRNILGNTFTALRRTALEQRMVFLENLFRVLATVVLAVAVAAQKGATGRFLGGLARWLPDAEPATLAPWLAGTYLVGVAASTVAGLWGLRRRPVPFGHYDPVLARRYFRFALPLALLGVVTVLANRLDSVMVGYFWSAGEVGRYFAAQRYATLIAIIPGAVGTLFFPLISELAARGSLEGVHQVAATAQRLLSFTIIPVVAGVWLFSEAIFHILVGDDFLGAAPILVWLAVHGVLVSLTVVSTSIVKGFDRPRTAAAAGMIALGLNAVLNLVFIPDSILGVPLLGMKGTGAAIATALSQAVSLVVLQASANRLTGRSYFGAYLVRQLVAGIVAWAVAWAVTRPWGLGTVDRAWELGLAGLLVLAVYAAMLAALGELTRRDLAFFQDLLHPGKMKEYVVEELGLRRT